MHRLLTAAALLATLSLCADAMLITVTFSPKPLTMKCGETKRLKATIKVVDGPKNTNVQGTFTLTLEGMPQTQLESISLPIATDSTNGNGSFDRTYDVTCRESDCLIIMKPISPAGAAFNVDFNAATVIAKYKSGDITETDSVEIKCVPEPSAFVPLAAGLVGLWALRKRS